MGIADIDLHFGQQQNIVEGGRKLADAAAHLVNDPAAGIRVRRKESAGFRTLTDGPVQRHLLARHDDCAVDQIRRAEDVARTVPVGLGIGAVNMCPKLCGKGGNRREGDILDIAG